jgi:hypothetical protein
MKEFQVNEYLSLRLEDENTIIYVGGERFRQCKYLLLNIPVDKMHSFDEIESIDEASERLDKSQEYADLKKIEIPPEAEFWGHCSNLQTWYENSYNTKLIHMSLAFPLLKRLYELEDPMAVKVFKEEIARRFVKGIPRVTIYLIEADYLEILDKNEVSFIIQELKEKNSQLYAFILPMLMKHNYVFQNYTRSRIKGLIDKFIMEEDTGAFRNLKLDEYLLWLRQQNITRLSIILEKELKK